MIRRLNDFIIEDSRGPGELDVDKLMQLSQQEFIDIIKNESKDYFKNHSVISDKLPNCNHCKIPIGNPNRLIRYFGLNLHPDCFSDIYGKKRHKLEKREIRYFDRILDLVI